MTNTIVSLTQIGDRTEFERAFACAVVHDIFNWLAVISLLVVEVITGYLFYLTSAIVNGIKVEQGQVGISGIKLSGVGILNLDLY